MALIGACPTMASGQKSGDWSNATRRDPDGIFSRIVNKNGIDDLLILTCEKNDQPSIQSRNVKIMISLAQRGLSRPVYEGDFLIRIDGGEATVEKWLGIGPNASPKRTDKQHWLVEALRVASTLTVRLRDNSNRAHIASFNVRGGEELISALKFDCRMPPQTGFYFNADGPPKLKPR